MAARLRIFRPCQIWCIVQITAIIAGLMANTATPAVGALIGIIDPRLVFVEVLIERDRTGFQLRHFSDERTDFSQLKELGILDLRTISQTTKSGAYRPLKCAPGLQTGWRCSVSTAGELELALHHLYPGVLADWNHWTTNPSSAVDYRAFTARQTGMYRITARLSDEGVQMVTRSQCAARFCGKRRVWTGPGLPPDEAGSKSIAPCLEPCPMLMEFARKAARGEQSEKAAIQLNAEEFEIIIQLIEAASANPDPHLRDADLAEPGNPRRLEFLLEKIRPVWELARSSNEVK